MRSLVEMPPGFSIWNECCGFLTARACMVNVSARQLARATSKRWLLPRGSSDIGHGVAMTCCSYRKESADAPGL